MVEREVLDVNLDLAKMRGLQERYLAVRDELRKLRPKLYRPLARRRFNKEYKEKLRQNICPLCDTPTLENGDYSDDKPWGSWFEHDNYSWQTCTNCERVVQFSVSRDKITLHY